MRLRPLRVRQDMREAKRSALPEPTLPVCRVVPNVLPDIRQVALVSDLGVEVAFLPEVEFLWPQSGGASTPSHAAFESPDPVAQQHVAIEHEDEVNVVWHDHELLYANPRQAPQLVKRFDNGDPQWGEHRGVVSYLREYPPPSRGVHRQEERANTAFGIRESMRDFSVHTPVIEGATEMLRLEAKKSSATTRPGHGETPRCARARRCRGGHRGTPGRDSVSPLHDARRGTESGGRRGAQSARSGHPEHPPNAPHHRASRKGETVSRPRTPPRSATTRPGQGEAPRNARARRCRGEAPRNARARHCLAPP